MDAAAPIPGTTSKDTASLNDAEVAAQKSMADTVAIERTDVAPKSAAGRASVARWVPSCTGPPRSRAALRET